MSGKALHGLCAVALVTATAVMAQPSGSGGGASRSDANKQICRTMADIGSRLGRSRACHTAQEWEELRRQTRQTVDHIQNARPWNTCPPNC
jgi:hypothetical protein